jgi:hypothetical protein
MVRSRCASLLLIAALLGCDSSVAPDPFLVRIEPLETQYVAGAEVRVIARNLGPTQIALTTCPARLERLDGQSWRRLEVPMDPCTSQGLLNLDVGATDTLFVGGAGTDDVSPGTYRYELLTVRSVSGDLLPRASRLSAPFLIIDD